MRSARVLLTVTLALVGLFMATSSPALARTWTVPKVSAEGAPTSLDDFENRLMVEINAARKANNVKPIRLFDGCTDRLAEKWGERIARTGAFEHRDQNQVIRRCDTTWAGETLIRGASLTPKSMVQAWLDSPGHRVIMLNRKAHRAGVAVVSDSEGRLIGVLNVVRPR